MKSNGTLKTPANGNGRNGNGLTREDFSDLILQGDQHIPGSVDTPLREDAFDLEDEEKMRIIESHFQDIMLTLGLDLSDDSLRGTGVAKALVNRLVADARSEGFTIVPVCSFVVAQYKRHPEWSDVMEAT